MLSVNMCHREGGGCRLEDVAGVDAHALHERCLLLVWQEVEGLGDALAGGR